MSENEVTRLERRENNEFRPIEVTLGSLENSDGSCSLNFQTHQLLVAIHGPVEVQSKDEVLGQAYLQVNFRNASTVSGVDTKFYESQLEKVFETSLILTSQPRSMVQVNLNFINLDGDVLSSCISGISLASLDASFPNQKLILSLCCIKLDEMLILDPTLEEIQRSGSKHTFAFSNLNGEEPKLEFQMSTGTYTFEEFTSAYSLVLDGCLRLHKSLPDLF